MLEQYTERARQVVVLAHEEVRTLKHNYIGTEHILLGLLGEEGCLAARVLAGLNVTIERVRAQVVEVTGPSEEALCDEFPFPGEEVLSGEFPFPLTPRAKKVLELALREAWSLGRDYVGTEHILLAVVREGEGEANHILRDAGANAKTIRDQVFRTLDSP